MADWIFFNIERIYTVVQHRPTFKCRRVVYLSLKKVSEKFLQQFVRHQGFSADVSPGIQGLAFTMISMFPAVTVMYLNQRPSCSVIYA